MRAPYLVCGIEGTALSVGERELLEELEPGGVILFARNVQSARQVADLAQSLAALRHRPYVAVDLEGGRVNRLRALFGDLPSARQAAAAGPEAVRVLGEACGALCAHLGIGVDYAPVVDVARPGGYLGGEDRCFGGDVMSVELNASKFLEGLEAHGVAGCLKHFPGLGSGSVDSHAELPELGDDVLAECAPFCTLAAPARAVMVAHALAPAMGDGTRPASLAPAVVRVARQSACGPVIGDDLEMGALERFGTIPERAAAALLAGCDQVLVCNALRERAETVEYVEGWARRSPDLAASVARAGQMVGDYGRQERIAVSSESAAERVEACWGACGGRP